MDDSGWIMAGSGGWVDYSTGVDGGGGMGWDYSGWFDFVVYGALYMPG